MQITCIVDFPGIRGMTSARNSGVMMVCIQQRYSLASGMVRGYKPSTGTTAYLEGGALDAG